MRLDDGQLEYGQGLKDDKDVQTFFGACLKDSEDFFRDPRERWDLYYAAYAGDAKRSVLDLEYLEKTHRPDLFLNLSLPTINALSGLDSSNQVEVEFKGVDLDPHDSAAAEIYTRSTRFYMQKARGGMHQAEAIRDMLLTGYGWCEQFLDTTRVPICPTPKQVNPWEMFPDPDAVENGLADARYIIRHRRWALESVTAKWPEFKKELDGLLDSSAMLGGTPSVSRANDWRKLSRQASHAVDVYEFQYMRLEPMVVYEDPDTGKSETVTSGEFETMMKARAELFKMATSVPPADPLAPAEDDPEAAALRAEDAARWDPASIESYRYAAKRYYRAFLAGKDGAHSVLEHRPILEGGFTYSCVTGMAMKMPKEGRVLRFGMMAVLYDIQCYLNRVASTILDTLARGAKGGGFIDEDALLTSLEQFAVERSRPAWWTIVRSGTTKAMIHELSSAPLPQGLDALLQLLIKMHGQVSLVTDFVKGSSVQERSNVFVSNQQQQAITGLAPLFSAIAEFRIHMGKVMARMIYQSVDPEDINRIIGTYEIPGVTTGPQMDPTTGQPQVDPMTGAPVIGVTATPADLVAASDPDAFDVTADLGQASASQRESVWNVLSNGEVFRLMAESGVPIGMLMPDLIRYFPVPAHVAKKWGDMIEQAMQAQQQNPAVAGGQPPPPTGDEGVVQ